jgi:uncharacterized protein (DUF2384 family)
LQRSSRSWSIECRIYRVERRFDPVLALGRRKPVQTRRVAQIVGGRTIIHDGLDRHYRDLLDQPVPALGNKSPRAAARTAKGRAKVVDWLKTIENHTAKFAGSNEEMATYDFSWLWTELGVNELRR